MSHEVSFLNGDNTSSFVVLPGEHCDPDVGGRRITILNLDELAQYDPSKDIPSDKPIVRNTDFDKFGPNDNIGI